VEKYQFPVPDGFPDNFAGFAVKPPESFARIPTNCTISGNKTETKPKHFRSYLKLRATLLVIFSDSHGKNVGY
jgi:hypothetical protein